jgi:putative transposase
MKKKDVEWAVFWCSLLQPLLFGEIDPRETGRFLRGLASREVLFPNGVRKKPSLRTLRRKLRTYRTKGFDALARKPRSDRGKSRAHGEEIVRRAVELKRDQPRRSSRTLNEFLEAEWGKRLPRSTLYRHLRRAGATRLKLGVTKKKVRRRWTRRHTHALWLGDFENGPYVLEGGQVVPTHLSVFLDCHSRFVVEGRYYLHENLDILVDSWLRAVVTHGAPGALYVDNAKVYRSRALRAACFALNLQRLHRKPKDPATGGLIEKFFQTAQNLFEEEVRRGPILPLDQLNRAFAAWLEMSYHRTPNRETNESPRERYEKGLVAIRRVDLEAILPFFFERAVRRVHKDFSDVQLAGKFYRVDPRLRGDKVEVRYDPFSKREEVWIYDLEERYLGKGRLHRRETGADPPAGAAPGPLRYSYLDLLVRRHEEELRERARGIDFRKAATSRGWSFPDFARRLARLLGRKGDLTAFETAELEALKPLYDRLPSLTPRLVEEAVSRAREKTLACVLYELQRLARRKET